MARKINHIDLPEGWEQQILEIYENGGYDAQVKKHIIKLRGKFSNHLWSKWMRESREFLEVIETGRVLSEAWWDERGRQIDSKGFNSSLWLMNMKNKFGWSDDKKDTSPVKVELKVDFVKPRE